MYSYLQSFSGFEIPLIKESTSFIKIYIFWSLIHYGIGHLYHKICIPDKFYKIFFTPFYTQSSHCRSLHWLYQTSINTISSISATTVTWSTKFLMENMSVQKIYKTE